MRCLWLALALSLSASVAEAQVQQGSFKLSIDTDLLNVSVLRQENPEADLYLTTKRVSFGPAGSSRATGLPGAAALAVGYVVHPHLIAQLHLGFSYDTTSSSSDGVDTQGAEPREGAIMLRPEIEVILNPESRAAAYGLLGLDYRHIGSFLDADEDAGIVDTDFVTNGVGPVFGAGLHFFTRGGQASFDLSVQFSYLVFAETVEVDGEEQDALESDTRASIFSLCLGASFWP